MRWMGVHYHCWCNVSRIRVQALVTTGGLATGESAEVDHTPLVDELLAGGLWVELRLRGGQDLPKRNSSNPTQPRRGRGKVRTTDSAGHSSGVKATS